MYYSFFEIFSIGVGPSSSHTVGPMRAAKRWLNNLRAQNLFEKVAKVDVTLYGSLALTGFGHGTVKAIVYGLMGLEAEEINPEIPYVNAVQQDKILHLGQERAIPFDLDKNVEFAKDIFLPEHSNGMRFKAYDEAGNILLNEVYFSVGGGTVARQDEMATRSEREPYKVPYDFESCKELMAICEKEQLSIADVVWKNECSLRSPTEVDAEITKKFRNNDYDPLEMIDWINLWGFAVAEENASGGQIVTAPTMGSAGIIPAVMRYYEKFAYVKSPYEINEGIKIFLLTASAICSLYRTNASISGAEVGCQGEVGVACSMAASGLVAAMGGTNRQIENAAEIAMEHNLGLTCDPLNGLVQVPCIERNAMGAIKAVNSARLALRGTGQHIVPLDSVIKTMFDTGKDMHNKYKETSLGGLAVNVTNC